MGAEHNPHAYQLAEAHEKHMNAQFQKYTRRMAKSRSIKENLSLTFTELYRREQAHKGEQGRYSSFADVQICEYAKPYTSNVY